MSHPPVDVVDELEARLETLRRTASYRQRKTAEGPCSTKILSQDQVLLSFASNDYLGLANHPRLAEAAAVGMAKWGIGAGASHLVGGHTRAHHALENCLAAFTGFPACLYFSTGYLANLAIAPALLGRGDTIFADKLNHASLVDAALLSRAKLVRYPHLDLAYLEQRLRAGSTGRKLIVSDAVFSMDGDIAPLRELLALAERYNAWLLVDDAHGFGVLGPQGRGSLADQALASPRLILMATLGKAAGVAGAFIAGSDTVIDWLIQKARPYIFTTASPPLLADALLTALELIEAEDDRRKRLNSNIRHFRDAVRLQRFTLLPSRTAIQPVLIGSDEDTVVVAEYLRSQGFYVPAIRPPTVPPGTGRLRISLSAAHTPADLDQLADTLQQAERATA
ncbi:MAG: 8-amino-7-oxononanoate synthase [Pseudomonadota bacterium]|jgi:8-amino-7-oxononanoate synthase